MENNYIITVVGKQTVDGESDKIEKVSLLGCGDLKFTQAYGLLNVMLPEKLPTNYTNCLKIITA